MATISNHIKSRKQWPALLAALAMTAVLGLAIAALGVNALINHNVVPALETPPDGQSLTHDQSTTAQLQDLIAQYQSREQQYQVELQQAADQLNATNAQLNSANGQLQQYQGLVAALQQAGVIQIASDGQVFLGRGASASSDAEGDND